jgi:hypothetical protein
LIAGICHIVIVGEYHIGVDASWTAKCNIEIARYGSAANILEIGIGAWQGYRNIAGVNGTA